MQDYRIKLKPCPACGYQLDAAARLTTQDDGEERGPQAGDYTVCIECAALLRFKEGLELMELSAADLEAMDAGGLMELMHVRRTVLKLHQLREPE